jgi:hypothetical protein
MKQKKNLMISFAELALLQEKILLQQPEITFAQALLQVQKLKKTSTIKQELDSKK